MNKLIDSQSLEVISMIVRDELHMIGDESRGYLLELMLSKVHYLNQSYKDKIQIIGMSATFPNL